MRSSPYAAEIRMIYTAALLIFVVTVVIGILNGTNLVDFSRDAILTHVHAGTLGWLTLSVMATTFWIFSEDGSQPVSRGATRWLAWLAGLSIVAYVGAFYSGNLPARATLAVPVLAAILWFLGWIWTAVRSTPLTMPRVGIVGAVFMLLVGGTIGTLIQVQMATGAQIFPAAGDMVGGHAVAMVFSYLILFGMVVAEWRLLGSRPGRLPRGGIAQIVLLLITGALSVVALLFNIQALLPLSIVFEVAAVAIFLVRLGSPILRAPWGVASSARQFALSAVFVAIDIGFVVATIAVFISVEGDINRFPAGLLIAGDHVTFIGVMTNGIFAVLLAGTERTPSASRGLAQVTFWGMNIGLVGFLIGLLTETEILKQVFTPIMGVSILIAIGAFALALNRPAMEDEVAATATA
jgi:hypothetical protein